MNQNRSEPRAKFIMANLSLIDKLRRRLAALISLLDNEPAGGIVPSHYDIDDGVDYSLPLVIPSGLNETERADYVKTIREASADFHFQFDKNYQGTNTPYNQLTADPLREWDFQTRREILSRCHMAFERNPLANSAVTITTMFSVGKGMAMTYKNKDVKAVVEAFRSNPENTIEKYEKEFCNDIQVDGELFIQYYDDGVGGTTIVPRPPFHIDWIETDVQFNKRAINYHMNAQLGNGAQQGFKVEMIYDNIPAADILHVPINKHSYEVRGRPELFRILPWLKAYKDWLEGRARQNHWRGSMLWDVSLDGATPTQVAAKRAQYKQPPPPGSLVVHNDKEHWAAVTNDVKAGDAGEDGRSIKLMVAIGAKLPEYMLGDGANSNLASSRSQQTPALKKFSEFQDIMINSVWIPIYDRVIQNAIDAGILPDMVEEQDSDGDPILDDDGLPKMIAAIDAYTVSAPELETDDPKNLADALAIAESRGWLSKEGAAVAMGYDYAQEQKKIKREAQEANTNAMQGAGSGSSVPLSPEDAQTIGELTNG